MNVVQMAENLRTRYCVFIEKFVILLAGSHVILFIALDRIDSSFFKYFELSSL